MKQLRLNTFETNSSSTHSFSITDLSLGPNRLTMDEDGYVVVYFGRFCSYEDYTSQDDRLAFLIQQLGYELECDFWCVSENEFAQDIEKLKSSEQFLRIEDLVRAYIGYEHCKGINIAYEEGYIDHESVYYSMDRFLMETGCTILEWIFGNDISFHIEFNG